MSDDTLLHGLTLQNASRQLGPGLALYKLFLVVPDGPMLITTSRCPTRSYLCLAPLVPLSLAVASSMLLASGSLLFVASA